MACRTGCVTQNHGSYSECLRDGLPRIAYCSSATGRDYTAQKTLDKDLAFYRDARAQGVQPSGTSRAQVENAMKISDKTGSAFDAG